MKAIVWTVDGRAKYGIGKALQSCHTAIVEGYAIEGHVPAADIWRLLAERPDAGDACRRR